MVTGLAPAQHDRPRPRRSALDRETAMSLADVEYSRYRDLLLELSPEDWSKPTDCPAWDVRAIAAHNLGMAEMAATFRELMRQNMKADRRAKRTGEAAIDAMTAIQVAEKSSLSPQELVERYGTAGPLAARGRRRRPAFFRNAKMPGTQRVNGADEPWTFGFIFDTILTRDCWMHRIDTARATGRDLAVTADHDGVIVADVVAEWASRYQLSCALTLTGPAGDSWRFQDSARELTIDAIEFCRILSGRPPADETAGNSLADTQVPF